MMPIKAIKKNFDLCKIMLVSSQSRLTENNLHTVKYTMIRATVSKQLIIELLNKFKST